MKILVVEDDELIAHALTVILTHQNYAVEVANDGEAALDLIQTFDYDLILLDVLLPKLDGISLCRQIRSKGLQMPILLLTGCDSTHEKAIGLDAGADDYLVKPFDKEELVARVRALLRRSGVTAQPVLEWGDLRLDPTSCEATYNTQMLPLTPKEYALLELFLRNSRRVFSCGMILEHLWSYEDTPGEEAVRTHIKGLRQKLKAVGAPRDLIETVYGIGYRLKPEVSKQGSTGELDNPKSRQFAGRTDPDGVMIGVSQPSGNWHTTGSKIPNSKSEQTILAVNEVWQRFKGRVEEQVSVLEQAGSCLTLEALNPELRSKAAQEAHTLAGSLGTFGFEKGSKLARKIEKLLKADKALLLGEAKNFCDLVAALRQEIEHKAVTQVLQKADHAEAKVLVVDDDPKIGALLQTLLGPWGLRVQTLADPRQFWEILAAVSPDLLILDVEMPYTNGIELCQLVRNEPRWSELPILFLTVHSDADIVNQIFSVGADDFVSKPIIGPELVTRIINRLERMKLLRYLAQTQRTKVVD